VLFDDQQRYSYRPSALARKITRAPAGAPPPPAAGEGQQSRRGRRRSRYA